LTVPLRCTGVTEDVFGSERLERQAHREELAHRARQHGPIRAKVMDDLAGVEVDDPQRQAALR
jgi:hypothetical protein